nr:Gal-binding and CUB domains containing receptor 3 [Arenicola marina]
MMDGKLYMTYLLAISFNLFTRCAANALTEVCDGERFNAQCGESEVIAVRTAKYGRMRLGRCVPTSFGSIGCHVDALAVADSLCSGRSECGFSVSPGTLIGEINRPCPAGLTSYLEIQYDCIGVTQIDGKQCRSGSSVHTWGEQGTLASGVTRNTGCGSLSAPWIIHASPGQLISISMTDFTHATSADIADDGCTAYGYISEEGMVANTTICGSPTRERHVHNSTSNMVTIQIVPQESVNFLLHYQVVGCPDISPPAHASAERKEDTLTITCQLREQSWHLSCRGTKWIGVVGNCSSEDPMRPSANDSSFQIKPATSMGLIVGLAGTNIILLFVLVVGYIYYRRSMNSPQRLPSINNYPGTPDYEHQYVSHVHGVAVPIHGQCGADRIYNKRSEAVATEPKDGQLHIWETPLPDPLASPLGSTECTTVIPLTPP